VLVFHIITVYNSKHMCAGRYFRTYGNVSLVWMTVAVLSCSHPTQQ